MAISTPLCAITVANAPLQAWLATAEPLGTWRTMPEVDGQRSTPNLTGVLYVGDAMGTIEPLTGQGMTMALLGAELAARTILSAPLGLNQQVQRDYQTAWNVRFDTTIARARWVGWLIVRTAAARAPYRGPCVSVGAGLILLQALHWLTVDERVEPHESNVVLDRR